MSANREVLGVPVSSSLVLFVALAWIAASAPCLAQTPAPAAAQSACGELVTIATHGATTTRYALAGPRDPSPQHKPLVLLLLPGGGGHVDLDEKACARALTGNSLVRSIPLFHADGFLTALADTPSDHPGEEGLAGFRASAAHADDLGKLIADVRARTGAPVWVIGTSRGTISAVNAAARLAGPAAPDGVVITSVLTVGSSSRQRAWVRQTVFDLKLEAIRVPVLVVGHADDACLRSPAALMSKVMSRITAERRQAVTVTGGTGVAGGAASVEDCQGLSPHGFIGQEAEVASGIARFIRGGRY